MSAIAQRFAQLRTQSAKALIPFITAGDPDLDTTVAALQALDQNGADLIELGLPYSDPLADGPVIQAAATRALARGLKLQAVLDRLKGIHLQAPLILFTYYNPILQMGLESFVEQAQAAGASGLVVPDLSAEEADPLIQVARAHALDLILLVAPTSSPERMRFLAERASGFLYLVSTTGVTGQRQSLAARLPQQIEQLRCQTDLPIGVGFGISNPAQAQQVTQWGADAAIVGSAFVQRLAEAPDPSSGIRAVASFCRALKASL